MNPILRETIVILFWSFFLSLIIGAGGALAFKWPLTATYLLSALIIGPTMAILRGRNREQDPLELSERAGVELLALILLIGIGWAGARYIGY